MANAYWVLSMCQHCAKRFTKDVSSEVRGNSMEQELLGPQITKEGSQA